jgi:hypothetical protein
LQHLVCRAPQQLQQAGSRWQLATMRAACEWLQKRSLACVWRTLKRFGLRLKRGRDYVHSPDPHYLEKLADIVAAFDAAMNSKGRIVLIFLDECSFYRQPSLSRDWWPQGRSQQRLAKRSLQTERCWRIIGGLNASSGQTTALMASKIGINQIVKFWQALRAAYPEAETIYVVVDNWPLHYHPDVLAALQAQATGWELKTPASWPQQARPSAKRLELPLQLLPLPTYASWCNPIEKLWRKLRQELLHLHGYADDWAKLKEKVQEFLDGLRTGSDELLRYVGLTAKSKLFGSLFVPKASPTG